MLVAPECGEPAPVALDRQILPPRRRGLPAAAGPAPWSRDDGTGRYDVKVVTVVNSRMVEVGAAMLLRMTADTDEMAGRS